MPLGQLADRLDELPRDKPLIVHCKLGGRSVTAVELLQRSGFENVVSLDGGILAWAQRIDSSMPTY
ncbi:putative adenylyltransferase/sulfurtransferase MoeZ [Rosistilla ulvae]|uniref:Putative adenylyltransferase/sulfurtransferase MoeZ n=1 Tax=Rosistilla ulvae TaxID=1930277 RepID=A0A517LZT6_9BACT|nr:rhodanese-like domain-containing protein [Rosistilla ulvae]QDS88130.1 putative adenylyltransferase/sulfurtransferase MoeZ [Rosistilla ulvae]